MATTCDNCGGSIKPHTFHYSLHPVGSQPTPAMVGYSDHKQFCALECLWVWAKNKRAAESGLFVDSRSEQAQQIDELINRYQDLADAGHSLNPYVVAEDLRQIRGLPPQ